MAVLIVYLLAEALSTYLLISDILCRISENQVYLLKSPFCIVETSFGTFPYNAVVVSGQVLELS